jgi:DNA-directed RNA polymerase beta' subunit
MLKNDSKYLHIRLASPDQIRSWAERRLTSGELVGLVTKPYTIHYQTGKPEPEGLFCEKIFGPVRHGFCYCGQFQGLIPNLLEEIKVWCDQCGVEVTDSKGRRHYMGYIKLECPVTHVWYLKSPPSFISRLLNQPVEELEFIVYYGV